jgi:hypothetical protein
MKLNRVTIGWDTQEDHRVHPQTLMAVVNFEMPDRSRPLAAFVVFDKYTGELRSPIRSSDETGDVQLTDDQRSQVESWAREFVESTHHTV